jgi:hypothetical protein
MVGGCREGDSAPPQPTPNPPPVSAPVRTDVLGGYYGTWENQIAETASHTNVQWAGPQWGTSGQVENVINRLREAQAFNVKCVVLDVPMSYLGEDSVRTYFRHLDAAKVIDSRICALYPEDEPDLVGRSAAEVTAANATVRRVAREFPFIAGIPIFTIYTCTRGFPGIESVDWASCDHYEDGPNVLARRYPALKARLRPDQRLALTAGGHQCDDPAPFYDYAQRDPQVVALVVFIWFDEWEKGKRGVSSLPCRASYVDALTKIKGTP